MGDEPGGEEHSCRRGRQRPLDTLPTAYAEHRRQQLFHHERAEGILSGCALRHRAKQGRHHIGHTAGLWPKHRVGCCWRTDSRERKWCAHCGECRERNEGKHRQCLPRTDGVSPGSPPVCILAAGRRKRFNPHTLQPPPELQSVHDSGIVCHSNDADVWFSACPEHCRREGSGHDRTNQCHTSEEMGIHPVEAHSLLAYCPVRANGVPAAVVGHLRHHLPRLTLADLSAGYAAGVVLLVVRTHRQQL